VPLRNRFAALFCKQMADASATEDLDLRATTLANSMVAASTVAKVEGRAAKRPWISQRSLDLIDQRENARKQGWGWAEKDLHCRVRASVKQDRKKWIDDELVGGPWSTVKALRKGKAKKPVQVRDGQGAVVDSDKRGDTMADYFEQVQWKVSFAGLAPTGTQALGATLPVMTSQFTIDELRAALKKLAIGKAPGSDKIPPEFWKVLAGSEPATIELLNMCQACWAQKKIPSQWRVATVVLLYKKGDASLPENYRPISLLPVGYKVLAMMLQRRLQDGGAE